MISDYDKKYNRMSKLYKSKWTSLKKINGWKHYEVASIDKNGIAAQKITIGAFNTNTEAGRQMSNTIDVGAKLTTYQSAFEAIRAGITNSTDYASLKANLLTALANV